jgi:hypothetical protein
MMHARIALTAAVLRRALLAGPALGFALLTYNSWPSSRSGRRARILWHERARMWRRLLTASVFIPTFAGVATAQSGRSEPVRDNTSGLTVVPPAGYSASQVAPTETRISVKKPSDRDTGCQVAFTPMPRNAAYTQDEINRLTATRQWLDLARATITLNYDVLDIAPFAQGDIRGVEFVGDLKQRPGIPPRSQDIRTLFFLLETPKGRTTTVCVGEKASFDARRIEFDAVAHGVTPPR